MKIAVDTSRPPRSTVRGRPTFTETTSTCSMVAVHAVGNLSTTFPRLSAMTQAGGMRIQLCGRLVVRLGARRVEDALPGVKGRLLFAFLVLNRLRRTDRDELLDAVYGEDASPDHQPRLSVLLSKLRSVVGPDLVAGRSQIELVLPPGTFVDVEAALEGLHRAESHVAAGECAEAWGPAGIAYHVAGRPLLQSHDLPWLDEWRRRLDDVRLRGLECVAAARLGLGGPTLPQAEECGRRLIALAPYRESGYRILMEALEQRGNVAEALLVYDRLRLLLHDELGIAPSQTVQRVYRRLLDDAAAARS
jgi:SARP family transcriptional regulator, regulator of embCAB operon